MTKQRLYKAAPKKNQRMVVHISVRDIEKKIRKPHAPPTKIHLSKKLYRRKPKHPKKDNEA